MKTFVYAEVMRRLNEEAGASPKHPIRRVVIHPAYGKAEIVNKEWSTQFGRVTNASRIFVSQHRIEAIMDDIRSELDDQFRNLNLD